MSPSGAQAAQQMRARQVQVANQAVKEVVEDLWPLVKPLAPFDQYLGWLRLMAQLLERYRRSAVEAAAVSYNELRRQQTEQVVTYQLPEVELGVSPKMLASLMATGPGRMRQLLKQGYAPEQAHRDALPLLSGVVTRQTLDAAREAVDLAVRDDEEAIGWARVTRPKACAFCLMMASRGAVYLSEQSATKVVGQRGRPRGSRGLGDAYHDDDRCIAVPVFSNDQGLPDLNRQLEQTWIDSTRGLSGKEALAAFRAATGAN
jgi:hypothetical protein